MEEKSREQEMSAREISLIRELAQIRKEYKRELEYEKFDGYELPPRTQFSMLNKPAVSIKYGVMKFNMACIRLFEGIKYGSCNCLCSVCCRSTDNRCTAFLYSWPTCVPADCRSPHSRESLQTGPPFRHRSACEFLFPESAAPVQTALPE